MVDFTALFEGLKSMRDNNNWPKEVREMAGATLGLLEGTPEQINQKLASLSNSEQKLQEHLAEFQEFLETLAPTLRNHTLRQRCLDNAQALSDNSEVFIHLLLSRLPEPGVIEDSLTRLKEFVDFVKEQDSDTLPESAETFLLTASTLLGITDSLGGVPRNRALAASSKVSELHHLIVALDDELEEENSTFGSAGEREAAEEEVGRYRNSVTLPLKAAVSGSMMVAAARQLELVTQNLAGINTELKEKLEAIQTFEKAMSRLVGILAVVGAVFGLLGVGGG